MSGMAPQDWWQQPRRVAVVIDNPSWILPFGERLVDAVSVGGDSARLFRSYDELEAGEVAFFLGCVGIAGPEVLRRHRRNLVVHESALPEGRGFSPLTWQILEGRDEIPICLLEADNEADAGPVYYRDIMRFTGHELIDEMRRIQGEKTIELCLRFLSAAAPPVGGPQRGQPSHYRRRKPVDSRLDPERSLAAQFELLRVVDNARYPAFFEHRGCRYRLTISKDGDV